jgi:hypothetical protein
MSKDEESKKPDLILSDGREVYIDLHQVTRNEWRGIWSISEGEEATDKSIAKITGIPAEDLGNLPADDYKRLTAALLKKWREPLADPT